MSVEILALQSTSLLFLNKETLQNGVGLNLLQFDVSHIERFKWKKFYGRVSNLLAFYFTTAFLFTQYMIRFSGHFQNTFKCFFQS